MQTFQLTRSTSASNLPTFKPASNLQLSPREKVTVDQRVEKLEMENKEQQEKIRQLTQSLTRTHELIANSSKKNAEIIQTVVQLCQATPGAKHIPPSIFDSTALSSAVSAPERASSKEDKLKKLAAEQPKQFLAKASTVIQQLTKKIAGRLQELQKNSPVVSFHASVLLEDADSTGQELSDQVHALQDAQKILGKVNNALEEVGEKDSAPVAKEAAEVVIGYLFGDSSSGEASETVRKLALAMENVKNTQVPLSNFLDEIEQGVRLKKVDLQSLDSKEQEDPNDLVAILKRAFLSLRGDISGSSVTNDTEVAPEEWQY